MHGKANRSSGSSKTIPRNDSQKALRQKAFRPGRIETFPQKKKNPYSAQTTALNPSSPPSVPLLPTGSVAIKPPNLPVAGSRAIIATFAEVCPPTATKVPALLIEKVLGYQPLALVDSTNVIAPVEALML